MPRLAAGLARAGLLRTFITSFGSTAPRVTSFAPLPRRARSRLERELRRRQVPAAIEDSRIEHAARAAEVALVATQRIASLRPLFMPVRGVRNAWVDTAAARALRATDDAFVGISGSALASLRRARSLGVYGFLNYPIAHYRFAERLLREEARLRPEFACTLQFHDLPAALAARLDAEVDEADTVFVLSEFQRRTFVESGVDPAKLVTTPLGVDLELYRPLPRRHDGVFRVLFVGQLTQRKGLSYLLDGFAAAAVPGSELVLVGNVVGSDAPWRARRGVRHVAHVPRWELPALYASADVLVLPSLIEGFGLVALEAMACGRAVVVSEHTFGADVISPGVDGYVVPIRDAAAIAETLRRLADDPDLRGRVASNARARAQELSWDAYGNRTARIVEGTTTEVRAA